MLPLLCITAYNTRCGTGRLIGVVGARTGHPETAFYPFRHSKPETSYLVRPRRRSGARGEGSLLNDGAANRSPWI
jgi:hypothetical protein